MREEATARPVLMWVPPVPSGETPVKELVAAGRSGRVNYIYSNRLNFGKIRTEENPLWSFAPHDIAVILRIAGTVPARVTCSGGSYITANLADVTVSCLEFSSGLRAHVFVSWLNPFKEQKLVVVGDRRMAVFNDVTPQDKLVLYDQRVDQATAVRCSRRTSGRSTARPTNPCATSASTSSSASSRRPPLTDASSGIQCRACSSLPGSLQSNGRPSAAGGDAVLGARD
jgi:UDP-2-acetamido-3-amino-2,3-dideoxy-glucuronate N-acetyltransferase